MKQIVHLLLLTTILSCSTKSHNLSTQTKNSLKTYQTNSTNTDALTINENCVVFLWPDSLEVAKMKAENSEDDFNTIMDDMTWYFSQAGMTCDTLKIKSYACTKEFIVFKNSENKIITLKCKELKGNMILFNVNKEPKSCYSIDFNKDSVLNYLDK